MPRVKKLIQPTVKPGMPPAQSEESRQNQMISLAVNCCEERMRNGTASSAEICHYLKLAVPARRLEEKKLEAELKLLEAKTAAIKASEERESMYADAIRAMQRYSGNSPVYEDEDDEDEDL